MSWNRFMVVFDNHGSECDKQAVDAMFKFKEEIWKPHESIHGGDNWNYAAIRKGASQEEREISMEKDHDEGLDFIKRYRPKYFTLGNHDWRAWLLATHGRGMIKDYASAHVAQIEKDLKSIKCHTLPYDSRNGILKYSDNQSIAHGYYHSVNCARESAVSYGNILVGHVHAFSNGRVKSLDERVGQAVGCLCSLDMEFEANRTTKLQKAHGWVYGVKNTRSNMSHYWLAQKTGDTWILPTDYVTL